MKPGPAPEHDDDPIASALQEVIDDEVNSQIANAFAIIWDMVKKLFSSCSAHPKLVIKGEAVPCVRSRRTCSRRQHQEGCA